MDHEHDETARRDAAETEAIICADCAASDSAEHDLDPVDHMPITAETLAGSPGGAPRAKGRNRKEFFRDAAIFSAAVYAATQIDWTQALEAAAQGDPDRKLCMIFLNGGNDGLQTMVPLAEYDTYLAKRTNLARLNGPGNGSRVGTVPVAGTGGAHGWAEVCMANTNGSPGGFDTLWGDGSGGAGADLAVFPAADYTPPNRSHFDSRDFWFQGSLEKLDTGWLGRWLDLYGSPDNPLQAISIGSRISKQIRSKSAPVSAVQTLSRTGFRVRRVYDGLVNVTEQMAPVSAVAARKSNAHLTRSREAFAQTVQAARSLRSLTQPSGVAGYPQSSLSDRLSLAAVLLAAPIGNRIVTVDWGSFDTHGNQLNSQDPQLEVLSGALAAFKNDLDTRGVGDKVVTCVFSEFGRRVASNKTGTDHGAGGLMALMGPRVRGGMAGEFPGLGSLDRGDLRVTTDFRSVYGTLIADWLGGDPAAVIPQNGFPTTVGRSMIT